MARTNGNAEPQRLYIGVDVGGTKVQASLVDESGGIVTRQRCPTPRDGGSEDVAATIQTAIDDAVKKVGKHPGGLTAIGVAIPGVVDPDAGHVVVTPNMSLTDVAIGPRLRDQFDVPIAVGNDGNLGALGERWLGSARNATSVLSICVGTGIGSGFVQGGKLWRGAREAAGEIGHIVMRIGGPKCGCGNRGCFEALAGRSAVERDIREAVAAGRKTVLTELTDGDLSIIRSSLLRRALEAEDELVAEIMHRAAEVIGAACLTVRHLIDPDVIVLGGGVMEACSEFMMPIIEDIVGSDRLPGARQSGGVRLSALGDDAVVLGAVAAARMLVGHSPFKKRFVARPAFPEITHYEFGEITIAGKAYDRDVCIRVDGKVKKRDKAVAKQQYGTSHTVGPEELEKVCRGGPEVLIIGAGESGMVELTDEARHFLERRAIECKLLPTGQAVEAYNQSERRRAALMHLTC